MTPGLLAPGFEDVWAVGAGAVTTYPAKFAVDIGPDQVKIGGG